MINFTIRFAIAVDETLFVVVVVLYSAASWTFEGDLEFSLCCFEGALVAVLFAELKALYFELSHEFIEIISMILQLLIPPDKTNLLFLALPLQISPDQDILEDALRSDDNLGYFIERTMLSLHSSD